MYLLIIGILTMITFGFWYYYIFILYKQLFFLHTFTIYYTFIILLHCIFFIINIKIKPYNGIKIPKKKKRNFVQVSSLERRHSEREERLHLLVEALSKGRLHGVLDNVIS